MKTSQIWDISFFRMPPCTLREYFRHWDLNKSVTVRSGWRVVSHVGKCVGKCGEIGVNLGENWWKWCGFEWNCVKLGGIGWNWVYWIVFNWIEFLYVAIYHSTLCACSFWLYYHWSSLSRLCCCYCIITWNTHVRTQRLATHRKRAVLKCATSNRQMCAISGPVTTRCGLYSVFLFLGSVGRGRSSDLPPSLLSWAAPVVGGVGFAERTEHDVKYSRRVVLVI